MLNAIRRFTQSWVMKGLLVLLVLSFAVWGVGDIFRSPSADVVATVGDADIYANEVNIALDQVVRSYAESTGQNLPRDTVIALGGLQQAVQNVVAERLLVQQADDWGLTVDDASIAQAIRNDPAFQDQLGTFDTARFQAILRANGLSEEAFVARVRQEVVRERVLDALIAPATAPQALVERLVSFENERRGGRLALVSANSITDLPEPDATALQEIYDNNIARFTAPERRSFTVVTLGTEQVAEGVAPDEEELRALYDERRDAYRVEETREVTQLLAQSEEDIRQALDRVNQGQSFDEVAAVMSDAGVVSLPLGAVTRASLLDPLAEPAFSLAEGAVSQPIESPFGWHLLRVEALTPERVTSFAEVRDTLRDEVIATRARGALPDLARALDDELAAGQSIEQAAATLNLPLTEVPLVDIGGRAIEGREAPALLDEAPEIVATAFQEQQGLPSLVEETSNGRFYALRVDDIAESALQPFGDVRDAVVALWQAQERLRLAAERAETVRQAFGEGRTLEAAAQDAGATISVIEPLVRSATAPQQNAVPAVVSALFATAAGQIHDEAVRLADAAVVVLTDEVIPLDTADPGSAQLIEQRRTALANEMRNDVLAQFEQALRAEYPVEINTAALGEAFAPAEQP